MPEPATATAPPFPSRALVEMAALLTVSCGPKLTPMLLALTLPVDAAVIVAPLLAVM